MLYNYHDRSDSAVAELLELSKDVWIFKQKVTFSENTTVKIYHFLSSKLWKRVDVLLGKLTIKEGRLLISSTKRQEK